MRAASASAIAGVEMFKKSLNEGQAGDNVGLHIRGIKRDDVERGQVRRSGAVPAVQHLPACFGF